MSSMHGIIKRVVTLTLTTFTACVSTFACATDESYDSSLTNVCPNMFCPAPAGATACCIDGKACGVDYGMGCVSAGKDGG